MSLFGTDDDGPVTPTRNRGWGAGASSGNGLFDGGDDDDDGPQSRSKSSAASSGLFADDSGTDDNFSTWNMPTPRKQQSRADLIRNLLPASDAPDSYIDIFETVVNEDGEGGSKHRIAAAGVAKLFAMARLDADAQAAVMSIVAPGNASEVSLGINEFNVLLALVGLAQEGDTISLDGVDERRRNLPRPKLSGLTAAPSLPPVAELSAKPPQTPTKPQSEARGSREPSQPAAPQQSPPSILRPVMDDPEDDPWNTPDVHKGHAHQKTNGTGISQSPNVPNGFNHVATPIAGNRASQAYRTSTEVAASPDAQKTNSGGAVDQPAWDFYGSSTPAAGGFTPGTNNVVANPFGGDSSGGGGSGSRPPPSHPVRTLGGRTGSNVEEIVLVTLMPGKEGIFMFQHHNYEISSQRRASKVIRRYSDFVWLLDCLQKRYPFRNLPLLPPKRVAVNGTHLSNDGGFIEKRRRGLARFLNALLRHPVLSQEQLVVMFLTVPTELAVWRKQSTISVQDEFTDRHMPPGLEDSLPTSLEELFIRTRSGVRRSAELYINVCSIMDRLVKRQEGVAADHARIATYLTSLTESSADTYATDTNEIPLLNDGLTAMSKHLSTCQALMEDEGRGWDEGVLEDLKRQRDSLVSIREMFERRERLDRDNIPYLERRIQTNETKLAGLRSKPEGTVKPGEIEKVAESIIKDKESIVNQHNRSVFVKECIRDELITFQSTQYHISRWNQDWAGERVKYAEMLADNWRRLLDELEGMPLGD